MSFNEEPKFQRDKEGKIKLIVDTFLKMLNNIEYSEISTNKIAKEADISIGTIYNYFRNKEEILQYIFSNITEDFIDISDVIKIIKDRDLEAIKKFISSFLKSHQDYYVINKAHDQAMIMNQNVFMDYQQNIKGYIRSFIHRAEEANLEIGPYSEEDLTKVFLVVLNIIDTQVHHHLFREPIFKSDKDLVNYLAQVFVLTMNLYLK